jgi:hypothetical protein
MLINSSLSCNAFVNTITGTLISMVSFIDQTERNGRLMLETTHKDQSWLDKLALAVGKDA